MSEMAIGWYATLKLVLVAIFATLYWIGGRDRPPKAWRRWVGGLLFPIGIVALAEIHGTFHWTMLGAVIAYPAALSVGYGADDVLDKLWKRGKYGFFLGACSAFFAFASGTWSLVLFQVGLAFCASIFFGLLNPVEAAEEEAIIAALSVIVVPFIV